MVIRMTAARHPLILLVIALGVAGAGLAVGHWRRTHPQLVERIEQFDRDLLSARVRDSPVGPPREPRREESGLPPSAPLDVNRATPDALRELPGVGPVLAARIVETRERTGNFVSVDDLRRVRGLGPAKLNRLRPLVTVAPPPTRR